MYENVRVVRFSGFPIPQQLVCLLGLRCPQVEEILFKECPITDLQVFVNPLSLNILRLPFQQLNLFSKLKIILHLSPTYNDTIRNLLNYLKNNVASDSHDHLETLHLVSNLINSIEIGQNFSVCHTHSRIMNSNITTFASWGTANISLLSLPFGSPYNHNQPYSWETNDMGIGIGTCLVPDVGFGNRLDFLFKHIDDYEKVRELVLQGHFLSLPNPEAYQFVGSGRLGLFEASLKYFSKIMGNEKLYKLLRKVGWSVMIPLHIVNVPISKLFHYTHLPIVYRTFCCVASGYKLFNKGMNIWKDLIDNLGEQVIKRLLKTISTEYPYEHPIYRALRRSNVEMILYLIEELDCPIAGLQFRNSASLLELCREFLTVERRNIVLLKPKPPKKSEVIVSESVWNSIFAFPPQQPPVNVEIEKTGPTKIDLDYSLCTDYRYLPLVMSQTQIDLFNHQVVKLMNILESKYRTTDLAPKPKKIKFKMENDF